MICPLEGGVRENVNVNEVVSINVAAVEDGEEVGAPLGTDVKPEFPLQITITKPTDEADEQDLQIRSDVYLDRVCA